MTRPLAVVTGASSGIGRAIARKLGTAGFDLLLQCHRNRGNLAEFDGAAEIVACDLSDHEALDGFCSRLDGAHTVVHAAAVTRTDLLPLLDDDAIDAMIAVNARAWVKICQGAVRSMMRARRGNLVAVTSVVASRAGRGQSVYAGTKAFQEGFIRALAGEVGSKGVRVNGVAPGPIASGSLVPYLAESREEVLASSALGRTGAPEDVAEVVGFLCSDAAAYIHGQILHVDGGCQRGVG